MSHAVRYISDGHCPTHVNKQCTTVERSPFKDYSESIKPSRLLGTISKRKELPDLGTGVVDTLNDLVTETGPLLDGDLIVPNNLSTEALLEFTCEPDKYICDNDLWGFADTDPAGKSRA